MSRPERQLHILIAGAGIGGLTAALALRQAGFQRITVLEQAARLMEVGAGIQLGPNAVKVLHHLGVSQALARVAVAPQARQSRDWASGKVIRDFPLGAACVERYGAPYYHAHRADLHSVLLDAFGREEIRLGARVTGVRQNEASVHADLAGGESIEGDVLIGADGVHSLVRAQIHGRSHDPRFTGLVAWRGIADADAVAHLGIERNVNSWWGPRRHFVAYYVSGGRKLNWVGIVPAGEWRLESWSARGDRSELLDELAGWHPAVRGLIESTDQVMKWALYDRDPWPVWTDRRITLLGDAAHPMVPFLAQGGAQAIEDGHVIAMCLARLSSDPVTALATYQALRTERTARVQLGAREAGQTFHLTNPLKKLVRNIQHRLSSRRGGESPWRQVDWLYGYDSIDAVDRQFGVPRSAATPMH